MFSEAYQGWPKQLHTDPNNPILTQTTPSPGNWMATSWFFSCSLSFRGLTLQKRSFNQQLSTKVSDCLTLQLFLAPIFFKTTQSGVKSAKKRGEKETVAVFLLLLIGDRLFYCLLHKICLPVKRVVTFVWFPSIEKLRNVLQFHLQND